MEKKVDLEEAKIKFVCKYNQFVNDYNEYCEISGKVEEKVPDLKKLTEEVKIDHLQIMKSEMKEVLDDLLDYFLEYIDAAITKKIDSKDTNLQKKDMFGSKI